MKKNNLFPDIHNNLPIAKLGVGTITCSFDLQTNSTVCKNVGRPVCPAPGSNVAPVPNCIPFVPGKNSTKNVDCPVPGPNVWMPPGCWRGSS